MNRLQRKRALITGGTTGIGLETAKQFLAEGAQVVVTGRSTDTLGLCGLIVYQAAGFDCAQPSIIAG